MKPCGTFNQHASVCDTEITVQLSNVLPGDFIYVYLDRKQSNIGDKSYILTVDVNSNVTIPIDGPALPGDSWIADFKKQDMSNAYLVYQNIDYLNLVINFRKTA